MPLNSFNILVEGSILPHVFWRISYWSEQICLQGRVIQVKFVLWQYPSVIIRFSILPKCVFHPFHGLMCCHQGQCVMVKQPIFPMGSAFHNPFQLLSILPHVFWRISYWSEQICLQGRVIQMKFVLWQYPSVIIRFSILPKCVFHIVLNQCQ
jgi:hypothetical protein